MKLAANNLRMQISRTDSQDHNHVAARHLLPRTTNTYSWSTEHLMTKTLVAFLLAAFAVGSVTLPASAAKNCPDGTYYDESTGKCVTKRGS